MKWLRELRRILELVGGAGDYARYCEHLRSRHPGCRLPSAGEFYLDRLRERYNRPTRCC